MIEGQEGVTWPQWQALASACEEHGIPALFRSDHYLPLNGSEERPVLDAWGTLCALAATTTTLRLGTLVSPATFRHPSEYAKLVATADQISGGRIEAGLGAGWHDREHAAFGFPYAGLGTRMDVFAEQLAIVRGLWSTDGELRHEGEHYTLDGVDPQPKPAQARMPLIVGGNAKPRSARLAAQYADEYNTPFATPDDVRERRAAVARAGEAEGRDPRTLRFSVMTGAALGRDRAEVREREQRLGAKMGHADWHAPPQWVSGTLDEAAEQLRALADAGCDRVMLQLLLHDELDQIALVEELQRAV